MPNNKVFFCNEGKTIIIVAFYFAWQIYSTSFKSRSWRGVLDTTWCDKVCQRLAAGRWFSPDTPVSSTNKADCHWNIVESGVKHHNHNSYVFSISIISQDLHSGVRNASFKLVLNETDEVKYTTEVLVKNEVSYFIRFHQIEIHKVTCKQKQQAELWKQNLTDI